MPICMGYIFAINGGGFPNLFTHSWFEQYRRLAKLNLQAHQSAMARSDEYVLEALLTFDKLGVVVHELLAIEAWKEVSPLLCTAVLCCSGRTLCENTVVTGYVCRALQRNHMIQQRASCGHVHGI